VGEFKDDEPWNGTEYDKNGNIIGKYVNGNYRTPYPPLKPINKL